MLPRWFRRRKPLPVRVEQLSLPAPADLGARVLRYAVVMDHVIDLTGRDVEGCHFDGCVVALWRGRPARIQYNRFTDCLLIGDGWGEFMFG